MNEQFSLTELPEFDDHELVLFATDAKTGLRSWIAVHNRNLGPATGGTRYCAYTSEADALRDALRLSRGMTYKCALAGVRYGGGKGVIIADTKRGKTNALLRAYAGKINLLNGIFTTGEDVGISERDVSVMARESRFINGRPGRAGDLAPWAALGVFVALRAALASVYGSDDVAGKTVAIKGLGKVGMELARLLEEQGAHLVGADIDASAIRAARKRFPKMKIVSPSRIHKERVGVYAPCALGNECNARTIQELRCDIICGGANNQLSTPEDGARLDRAGIVYVPDYAANAGGLINVAGELRKGGYDRKWVEKKVMDIEKTVKKIIDGAKSTHRPTSDVADRLAEKIIGIKR